MALTDLGRVCPVPQGAYNAATPYSRLDIVTFEGSSYICKSSTTGNSPIDTTYWQILAQGALGAAGTPSRPNLLHNWDFRNPVNQRAVSGTISTAGYFYDRWMLNSGSIVTNAAYLTLGAGTEIEQRIEGNLLAGETVTVSVMAGGTVFIGMGAMPISGTASVTLVGWGTATLGYATGYMYIRLSPTAASNVVQVKLELGTVSTLVYDPPMDYGTELAKCRRYFFKLGGDSPAPYYRFPNGVAVSSTIVGSHIAFPTKMRVTPTMSYVGAFMFIDGGNVSSIAPSSDGDGTDSHYVSYLAATAKTPGYSYSIRANNDITTALMFSADL